MTDDRLRAYERELRRTGLAFKVLSKDELILIRKTMRAELRRLKARIKDNNNCARLKDFSSRIILLEKSIGLLNED